MIAEDRARELNSFLNLLTAWYSFWLIAVAVANLTGSLTHAIVGFSATLMSIALFGLSLYLLGGRIAQVADEHRRCYLALKAIYHSPGTDDEKIDKYNSELDRYSNHKTIDYDMMVCDAASRGQQLWNEDGPVSVTTDMTNRVTKYKRHRAGLAVFLVFLPILLVCTAVALAGQTGVQATSHPQQTGS